MDVRLIETTKQRRSLDVEGLYKEHNPAGWEREQALLHEGCVWADDCFSSSRNLSLGTRTLIPPESNFNGKAIVFCHGYTDHLRWLMKDVFFTYCERGYLVTGLELEGHGLSDTLNGLLSDVDLAVEDLHEFICRQQERYPSVEKWFLHGNSMGGAVAVLESLRAKGKDDGDMIKLQGMVLSCPMLVIGEEVRPGPVMISVLSLLASIFPTAPIVPTGVAKGNGMLTYKDDDIRAFVMNDPLKYRGKPRLATAVALNAYTIELEKRMSEVSIPFMIVHGKKDQVTSFKGSEEFYEKTTLVDPRDKHIVLPEEAFHGVLTAEPKEDLEVYWRQVFEWLESR